MSYLMGCTRRRWPLAAALVVSLAFLLLLLPRAALAQTPAPGAGTPTALAVSAPASVELGQRVTVQARLAGTAGPIVKATIYITVPMTFLHVTGDMVVASALTDGEGLATAVFAARSSGPLTVNAVFQGNATHAPSKASTQLTVSGDRQLYEQEVLPSVPGINAAPVASLGSSGTTRWLLTGWPIAAVLILVWSAFAAAVLSMWRIVGRSRRADAGEGVGR